MKKVFKVIIWAVVIIIIVYFAFASLGFWHRAQIDKTERAIGFINSRRITLDDVLGKNLPPKPDQALNDSTVAGFDVNNNGIRDDVELTIFEKYPNSAKIRAAMLQYAQALQLELTEVFNSETLVATLQKAELGYRCMGDVNQKNIDVYQEEIQNLVINTDLRKKALDNSYKYLTGHGYKNQMECDVNLSSLPN